MFIMLNIILQINLIMKVLILAFLFILSANSNFVEQQPIIDYVNNYGGSWKAGHNHYFDGKTFDQIKSLMGALETPEHLKLKEKQIIPLEDIPESFQSAENWPNCQSIKEIRDQSNCGSCWAFGAAQAMSDRICIMSGQKLQVRISTQDLLACCGWCGYGCGGGYTDVAWNYFYKTGISTGYLYNDTEWCMPYTFPPCDHHTTGKYEPCQGTRHTPQCIQKCQPSYKIDYKTDRWRAETVYVVPSNKISKIQTQILTYGPVETTFKVHTDFLTYKSGVYEHIHGSAVGQHAVKIVGWGVENKIPYWTVANSWNEDWGDKGFFKIRRGDDECGIENRIVAGIPKIKSLHLSSI